MEENSTYTIANEISNVLSKELQVQLRCGICFSTLKKPIIPSCNHAFCSDCLHQCFQRKNTIECPICRYSIKKRSCVVSDNLQALTDAYLQLARNFKRDVKEHAISIPKEQAFMESQAIISTQAMESPLRSFQVESKFAIPAGRPRNKRRNPEAELAIAKSSKMPRLSSVKEEIVDNEKSVGALPSTAVDEDDEEILLFDDPPKLAPESKPLDFGFPTMPHKETNKEFTPLRRPNTDKEPKLTALAEEKPGKKNEENVARLKLLLQRKPWTSPKMGKTDFLTALNKADSKPSKAQEHVLSLLRKSTSPALKKPVSPSKKKAQLHSNNLVSPDNKKHVNASPDKLPSIKVEVDGQSTSCSAPFDDVSQTAKKVKLLLSSPAQLGCSKAKIESKCSSSPSCDVSPPKRTEKQRKTTRQGDTPSSSSKFDGLLDAVEKMKGSNGISSIDAVLELVPGLVSILLKDQDRLIEILDLNVRKSVAEPICSKCKGSNDSEVVELANGTLSNSVSMHSESNNADRSPKNVPAQPASLDDDCIMLEDTSSLANSGSSKASSVLTSMGEMHNKENFSANSSLLSPTSPYPRHKSRLGTHIIEPSLPKPDRMVIVVTRVHTKEDEILLHEFTIRFPEVTVIEEVTENCTHLVLFNSKDRTFYQHSLAYVRAIAYECEMLNRDWMLQSVKLGKVQRTHKYTIECDHGYPAENPAWIRRRYGPPLLQGMKFYLPMSVADCNTVPRKTLVDIIQASGGTIITNNLSDIKAPDCKIIFGPRSEQRAEARRFEHRFKVPVISADWILKGVAEWCLPKSVNSYRVYANGSVS